MKGTEKRARVPASVDDLHSKTISAGEQLESVAPVGLPRDPEIDRGVAYPELSKRHL
jgi:hypothetical protein